MARQSVNALHNTFPAADFEKLMAKCRGLPLARENYRVEDYVENLFLTVLDFQMKSVTVERAMDYYQKHAKSTVSDYDSLKKLLAQYPDTKEGNRQVARYLWGYNPHGLTLLTLGQFEPRSPTDTGIGVLNRLAA